MNWLVLGDIVDEDHCCFAMTRFYLAEGAEASGVRRVATYSHGIFSNGRIHDLVSHPMLRQPTTELCENYTHLTKTAVLQCRHKGEGGRAGLSSKPCLR